MQGIIKVGKWILIPTNYKGIRAEEYGAPYDGNVYVNIANGEANVEGLLMKDDANFTRTDYKDIKEAVRQIGFDNFKFDRFKAQKKIKRIRPTS